MKFSAQLFVLFGLVATAMANNAPIEARDPKKGKTGGSSDDAQDAVGTLQLFPASACDLTWYGTASAVASSSFAVPTAAPRIAGVAAVGAVAAAAAYW
jgi:hypothetical protein